MKSIVHENSKISYVSVLYSYPTSLLVQYCYIHIFWHIPIFYTTFGIPLLEKFKIPFSLITLLNHILTHAILPSQSCPPQKYHKEQLIFILNKWVSKCMGLSWGGSSYLFTYININTLFNVCLEPYLLPSKSRHYCENYCEQLLGVTHI